MFHNVQRPTSFMVRARALHRPPPSMHAIAALALALTATLAGAAAAAPPHLIFVLADDLCV